MLTFINIRSPTTVNEVQQLTRCLACLSRFLSCVWDNIFTFFDILRNKEKFEWAYECVDAFTRLNTFMATLSVLTHITEYVSLFLYLYVTYREMIYMLIQEKDNNEM